MIQSINLLLGLTDSNFFFISYFIAGTLLIIFQVELIHLFSFIFNRNRKFKL